MEETQIKLPTTKNEPNLRMNPDNSEAKKDFEVEENSEENVSISSFESENHEDRSPETTRPSSSLSVTSSRIPVRLARSASLSEKRPRSLSFIMNGTTNGSPLSRTPIGRSNIPATPELKRRSTSMFSSTYISPYSRKVIAAERKNQNNSWRSGEATSEEDDTFSEKSFGSVSSTRSLDVAGLRRTGAGFWGTTKRRPRNILHCSQAHSHDPDDYLTPTQRAAKKIRELQASLKRAKNEILERDLQISSLTRDLVELRMSHNEHERKGHKSGSGGEGSVDSHLRDDSMFPSCLTADLEHSRRNSKMESREKKFSNASTSEKPYPKGGDQDNPRYSPTNVSLGGDSDSGDLNRSLADSGHYEDLPSPCMSSRDSLDLGIPSVRRIISSICASEKKEKGNVGIWAAVGAAEEGLRAEWTRRVEELKGNHMEEYHELKERHNDKVEMLLSKLSDANLKYFELRPQFDKSQEMVKELEKEVERLKDELRECEIRQQSVYLQMYLKGQESARLEAEDKCTKDGDDISSTMEEDEEEEEEERKASKKGMREKGGKMESNMVFSLMTQLAQSEDEIQRLKVHKQETTRRASGRNIKEDIDPEITLQFLKSAIYYFLTDKENAQRHLRAIESILGYSSVEKGNITRNYRI